VTNSILAIKGNHLDKQIDIFNTFRYNDLHLDNPFDNLSDMYAYLVDNYFSFSERDIALRGIWVDNNWTMICDPETVDFLNDAALVKISEILDSDVMTFLIQTTSSSFGFARYNRFRQRHFFSVAGNLTSNEGIPLPEETGLNINEQIFANDIISIAHKLGIDFEKTAKQTCIAKQLGYSEELKKELELFNSARLKTPTKKTTPWWKLW
jgi:hypothetical protein